MPVSYGPRDILYHGRLKFLRIQPPYLRKTQGLLYLSQSVGNTSLPMLAVMSTVRSRLPTTDGVQACELVTDHTGKWQLLLRLGLALGDLLIETRQPEWASGTGDAWVEASRGRAHRVQRTACAEAGAVAVN
jgi:hypothetical protein